MGGFSAIASGKMQTEAVALTTANLRAQKTDSTGGAAQNYAVETLLTTLTIAVADMPTWMKTYGLRATLWVEFDATYAAANNFRLRTTVNAADEVDNTHAGTSGAVTYRNVHTDITDFTAPLEVNVYCTTFGGNLITWTAIRVTLQIGTKSITEVEVARITGISSLLFSFGIWTYKVISLATNTALPSIRDDTGAVPISGVAASYNSVQKNTYTFDTTFPVNSYLRLLLATSLTTDPAVFDSFYYTRVWIS